METKHTPTPWSGNGTQIVGVDNGYDVHIASVLQKSDRDFIVRACNAHEELVAILAEIIEPPPQGWDLLSAATLMDTARNVLAKARGEA